MSFTNPSGVCRFFASSGKCRFGSGCKFSHNNDSSSSSSSAPFPRPRSDPVKQKSPCHFFQKHGNCRLGDDCKYSHDPNLPRPVEDPSGAESLYSGWKRLLGKKHNYGPNPDLMSDQMEKFLSDALQILEIGTTGTIQQLIRDLGSDNGLRRIAQLVETTFVSGYSLQRLSFKKHAITFLKVMAHESMRNSLVLEREVGTIFNFLYGPNGRRGIGFFRQVADNLSELSRTGDKEDFESAFSAATSALFNTLNMNQGASVQEAFKPIVDLLSTCATKNGSDGVFDYAFRVSQDELSRIRTLLNMGDAIPRAKGILPSRFAKDPKLQYQMQVDFPGGLSREGPRHDNDHSDISKIHILPSTEEILSHRNQFLPQRSLDCPHHLEGISRVLDFQFRLLREDTSGQLREAVRVVHEDWQELIETEKKKGKKDWGRKSGIHTLIYKNARTERAGFSEKEGLVLTMTFDQPSRVQGLSNRARTEWWGRSKFLAPGSLLCLMDSSKRSTFLVVSQRRRDQAISDLASDPKRCTVKFRFAESISQDDIVNIFNSVAGFVDADTTRALVEFPGLLFASFEPVLKTLQQLSKSANLPFQKWLAPSPIYHYYPDTESEYTLVPPPLYMTKPGTEIDLSSITSGYPLKYSINRPFRMEELEAHTTLDKGQCRALIASLSQEMSLIQGPPGTGKSYLGVQIVKVLLANRLKTKIGPIICVCYTNHALDQFLKHLLDEGVTNIVRVGSRSKEEQLEPLSLHTVCQNSQEPTVMERQEIGKTFHRLESIGAEMGDACFQLLNPNHSYTLKKYLEDHHPQAYQILFGFEDDSEDEEGFKTVRRKNKGGHHWIIENWIRNKDLHFPYHAKTNRPIDELLRIDIRRMSYEEKLKLRQYWLDDMRTEASSELLQGIGEHMESRAHLNKQYQEKERRCLLASNVIGVTTTGFASRSELIRSLTTKVLVCEEAAEVLEAHILSALLPTLEHTILIGDHKQLRPQIMNHDFSVENPRGGAKYGLDTSLFERTAEYERYGGRKFPIAELETQRRMHPSISALIRNTLYPKLQDAPNMRENPPVPGLEKRLFWMDHRHLEDGADKTELIQTSHSNNFEVDMVVALVRHLSRQGVYKSGDIAVLTPYLRQMFNLRKKLASVFDVVVGDKDQEQLDLEESKEDRDLELDPPTTRQKEVKKGDLLSEVRVATVDNFQGEEAKVVIISLVRSNDAKKCGFLKTSNRINVLLSRAKDGMYIFGNALTCTGVEMWSDVIGMLEQEGNIDETLQLRCPRHPDTPINVKTPEEFHIFSPEGGCMERCEWRLDCGHPCPTKCHSETLHRNGVCMVECERAFKHCDHSCPKPCGFDCGRCETSVPGTWLPCGHPSSALKCFQLQDLAQVKCQTMVKRELPLCGHVVSLKCYIDINKHNCNEPCGANLPCGHQCTMECQKCTRLDDDQQTIITNHSTCTVPCGRKFTNCKHSCSVPCHGGDTCKPCSEPCEVRCAHSLCGKKCSEACAPCAEECGWSCKHREVHCEMPCAAPCDINPCFERCDLQLDCSHQCPSVCGEKCPSPKYCQECGSEEILNREVDLIMFETYRNINLDEDPVIVPECGHFYTLDTYDNHMDLKRVYKFNMFGKIVGPRPLDGSDEPADGDSEREKLKIKNCPDCRAPLRNIYRYNRIVKSASLDEATRRFGVSSNVELTKLYNEVSDAEDLQEATRGDFLRNLKFSPGNDAKPSSKQLQDRAGRNRNLAKRLQTYVSKVKEEEQPYGKVRQLVLNAEKRKGTQSNFVVDSSMVQFGFRLKGQLLFFQLRWVDLWDRHKITTDPKIPEGLRKSHRIHILTQLKKMRTECGTLITDCQNAKMERQECEARIHQAQFFALYRDKMISERQISPLEARMANLGLGQVERPPLQEPIPEDAGQESLEEMRESLDYCETLCRKFLGSIGPLKERVDQARRLLNGASVFYAPLSTEEKRLVHLAMSAEFSSTGRWYTCPNGHPFTIGDCGMARQARPCPDCGATIGGEDYQLASGVQRARDFSQFDDQHGRGRLRNFP
ncbi:hypothetical protein L873DRAFT_1753088 [Choiromyces venosus 120613-1]|uniref:P-loop containing nucleoside triphosphate hydrolase protein n=1 Tax=Choiromyces venosus 120613-1 TaxID=1336337 RepID=A0A3N4JAQ0_9PEZI|nr:hypothetical protein L873DRAFT_1753088 [Choiromyces venosus 120613-1]